MFAEERLSKIASMIKEGKRVTVNELSEKFDVSESTIRRDLKKLEKDDEIIRTHGGAINKSGFAHEVPLSDREVFQMEEKRLIAAEAVKNIEEEDVVLIDAGSTTMELAKKINNLNKLTIITNALNICNYLTENSDIDILLIGGNVNRKNKSLIGPIALDILDNFHVNKLFMGIHGITAENGLNEPTIEAAVVKKKMIDISEEVFVLADYSKIGKAFLKKVNDFRKIDHLITNKNADPQFVETLRKKSVDVILV